MKKRKVKTEDPKDEIDPIKEENPFKKPVKATSTEKSVDSKIKRMSYKKGKTIKYIKFRVPKEAFPAEDDLICDQNQDELEDGEIPENPNKELDICKTSIGNDISNSSDIFRIKRV